MTSPVASIDGLDNLNRTLDGFVRDLDDLDTAAQSAGNTVLNLARGKAPRRTGRLASSGFVDVDGSNASIGFSAPHAAPIEFGVGPRAGLRGPHNITPRRFLSSAFTDAEPAVLDDYEAAVTAALGKVKGA
jgi:hypothetical protein